MAGSGIMQHEVDRHLVASQIYLARVDKELGKIPQGLVTEERLAKLQKLVAQVKKDIDALEEVRTGRKSTRRKPTTIAEVSDLDQYRADFIEGQPGVARTTTKKKPRA